MRAFWIGDSGLGIGDGGSAVGRLAHNGLSKATGGTPAPLTGESRLRQGYGGRFEGQGSPPICFCETNPIYFDIK
jgi:hypothetical protein